MHNRQFIDNERVKVLLDDMLIKKAQHSKYHGGSNKLRNFGY